MFFVAPSLSVFMYFVIVIIVHFCASLTLDVSILKFISRSLVKFVTLIST